MALTVQRKCFASISEALDDIRKNGTWPTTLVSGPSRGRQVHWHSEEVHAYVMEGETDFLDAATNERIPVGPGDKVVIPARALHAEGAVKDKVVYLIALPGPVAYDEFLKARPEDELRRG